MIRTISIVAIVAGLSWLGFNNASLVRHATWSIADRFDDRPARTMLFLGNSRMYYNSMPDIVRNIADSASVPQKYQITMRALPGASLEQLWNDDEVQRLLDEKHWDDVIIRGETRAHLSATNLASFMEYGELLIRKAQRGGASAALIVNWNYGPERFKNPTPEIMEEHDRVIQRDYHALADRTGARLINSGVSWRIVSEAEPSIPLFTDGNHPSLHGSYLSALTIFACLAGSDDFVVSYAPWWLSSEQAQRMREAMAKSPARSLLCRQSGSYSQDLRPGIL
jgi:hypothetical protein